MLRLVRHAYGKRSAPRLPAQRHPLALGHRPPPRPPATTPRCHFRWLPRGTANLSRLISRLISQPALHREPTGEPSPPACVWHERSLGFVRAVGVSAHPARHSGAAARRGPVGVVRFQQHVQPLGRHHRPATTGSSCCPPCSVQALRLRQHALPHTCSAIASSENLSVLSQDLFWAGNQCNFLVAIHPQVGVGKIENKPTALRATWSSIKQDDDMDDPFAKLEMSCRNC